MIRRRYRIEASTATLLRFMKILGEFNPSESFVQRVTCNSGEEYYYVVCITEKRVHDALHAGRFQDHLIYT